MTDPLLFYAEAIPKNASRVEVDDINAQYLSEFLEALQSSINQMSADGIRISYVASKGRELGQYMSDVLDYQWKDQRGMEIQSVGIASISYDEESKELIHLRNQGAMLSDPGVREGYVQGAVARGLEAAGSNANGSMAGFMGMGMGMNAGGGFMGAASSANYQQMQMNRAQQGNPGEQTAAGGESKAQSSSESPWTCSCGSVNTGKFCPECGNPKQAGPWTCECKTVNNGRFCSECGKPRP